MRRADSTRQSCCMLNFIIAILEYEVVLDQYLIGSSTERRHSLIHCPRCHKVSTNSSIFVILSFIFIEPLSVPPRH